MALQMTIAGLLSTLQTSRVCVPLNCATSTIVMTIEARNLLLFVSLVLLAHAVENIVLFIIPLCVYRCAVVFNVSRPFLVSVVTAFERERERAMK